MVTTSASGLDPDITVANARAQAPRVATARGMRSRPSCALVRRTRAGASWGSSASRASTSCALNLALDSSARGGGPDHARRRPDCRGARLACARSRKRGRAQGLPRRCAGCRQDLHACSPRRTAASRAVRTSSSASSRRTAGPRRPHCVEGLEQVPLQEPRVPRQARSTRWTPTRSSPATPSGCWWMSWRTPTSPARATPSGGRAWRRSCDAGINVISTLNVQHLESLNDAVFEITGVRVRETLPDSLVDEADEVVARRPDAGRAPQPPAARRHLRPRQDPQALANFFRRAISWPCASSRCARPRRRWTSSSSGYIAEHELEPWATEERVVVCVSPSPSRPSSSAAATGSPGASRAVLGPARARAGQLGRVPTQAGRAALRTDSGAGWRGRRDGTATHRRAILRFAREQRATFIVLGQSQRSRVDEVLAARGSPG